MSPYVLIAVVVLMLAPPEPLPEPLALERRGLAALFMITAVAFLGEALASLIVRRLERQFDRRHGILRLAGWLNGALQLVALTLFVILLYVCQWNSVGAWIATQYARGSMVVAASIALWPYIVAKMFTIASWFQVERTLRAQHLEAGHDTPGFPNLRQFVAFQMRMSCGWFVAVLLLRAGLGDAILTINPHLKQDPLWYAVYECGAVALALLAAPWLLRVLWNAHSLPAGSLRSELEHLWMRVGYRCSDPGWPTAKA